MKRLLIATVVVAMLGSLTGQGVLAHGGGLDSDGCHHNWADGSGHYHCHRDSDRDDGDDVDWGTVAAVLGGLLVVGIVVRMLSSDPSTTYLGFTPELAADQDGNAYAGTRWTINW